MPSDAEILVAMPGALRAMADNAERMLGVVGADQVAKLEAEIKDLRFNLQRRDDLVVELRRQLAALERRLTPERTTST